MVCTVAVIGNYSFFCALSFSAITVLSVNDIRIHSCLVLRVVPELPIRSSVFSEHEQRKAIY